jgi:1-acyl-sn-glycerol-3-phosphate acyltransferase
VPLEPLNDRRGLLERIGATLRAIPMVIAGFVTLIAINVAQTVSLVVMPFSRQTFRRFNRSCANTWWGWCVLVAENINGTKLVLTGDDLPTDENALVISNHQQMPDITSLMALARSKGRLGDLKFFVKQTIKWFPGVGWGMQFLNCPFLRRDWTKDRETIDRTFATLVRERIPFWLVSFAEGTRVTPEKVLKNTEWAAARGIAATRHVLTPRTKGVVATVEGLGDHLHAIYDVTIGYEDGVPNLWQHIRGSVKRVHVHFRRYPVDNLPRIPEELGEWLIERFREKDELLEHFYSEGVFPAEEVMSHQ